MSADQKQERRGATMGIAAEEVETCPIGKGGGNRRKSAHHRPLGHRFSHNANEQKEENEEEGGQSGMEFKSALSGFRSTFGGVRSFVRMRILFSWI